MSLARKHRIASWKVLRRCVIFFMAICVIPVTLVLLVTTDQYMKPNRVGEMGFIRPQISDAVISSQVKLTKNLTAVAERLEKRKMFLKRTCSNLGLDIPGNDSLHKPNAWEFLVNTQDHIIWCNVFKAASTSWMYNFNILAGYSPGFLQKTKMVPLHLARQKYPRVPLDDLKKSFNDSLSFLIVRHPLERLMSAYKDKLQHALPHSYHQQLGNQIIKKYRSKTFRKSDTRWPSFEEFILYLFDCIKDGETLDMHWTPITEFCTPCMFDFDVIAHTETLQEDQEYIIFKAGLQHKIKPEWKNSGRGVTAQQIEKYYSQITRAQILQLYHIYRYDFELFNYTLNGYIEVGQIDKDPSALLQAINIKDSNIKVTDG
ncbi:carbohydrate sulfotransferase 11 [Onthophagus taurus]|uniref:carbohydrate sulfotransferase 11 n=1 Tax=Onthophagus taurus TaxID=166361 RepID=UPI0039BE1EC2